MENAGIDSNEIITKARTLSAKGFGYDVMKLENIEDAVPVDMVASGIIDPLKVVRSAVQNAVSVAAMVLTTEALITDKPEKTPAPAMPQMPGGMDY